MACACLEQVEQLCGRKAQVNRICGINCRFYALYSIAKSQYRIALVRTRNEFCFFCPKMKKALSTQDFWASNKLNTNSCLNLAFVGGEIRRCSVSVLANLSASAERARVHNKKYKSSKLVFKRLEFGGVCETQNYLGKIMQISPP